MSFFLVVNYVFWGTVAATAVLTLPFRAFAAKFEMLDYPDKYRKFHGKPVPVGGGLIVFIVMTALICLLVAFKDVVGVKLGLSPKLLLPLIIVSPFIVVIGLIDDKKGLSGKTKLFYQILAASVIIGFAKYYTEITYFGIELKLHHLFYPLAVFWIIGMINSINLLDGADGVAVTVGFYMSLATAAMAYFNGHLGIALLSLGLAGSLLGFFLHNRPPAKVYLGDTGSMFVGLMLGTLMLRASVEADRTIFICGPLAIVLIPMVDSLFAVIRRINLGRPIFSPDRGHIHHLLSLKVTSPYNVLLLLSLLVIPGCVAAVLGTYYKNDVIPVATAAVVLVITVALDLFGRRELLILFGRLKGRFRKSFHKRKYVRKNGESYHIQGNGPWRKLWHLLVPILSEYPCRRLQLDINIPSKNEDFFGEWENIVFNNGQQTVYCSISLVVEGINVGILRVGFDGGEIARDKLLLFSSELANMCELSIEEYLRTEDWDYSFSILSFDGIRKESGKKKKAYPYRKKRVV